MDPRMKTLRATCKDQLTEIKVISHPNTEWAINIKKVNGAH